MAINDRLLPFYLVESRFLKLPKGDRNKAKLIRVRCQKGEDVGYIQHTMTVECRGRNARSPLIKCEVVEAKAW